MAVTHQIVVRELMRRAPGLRSSTDCFASYDELAARDALGRALDAVATTPEDEAAIVDAALDAFEVQHLWICPQRPSASMLGFALPTQRIAQG
jgi:hypothetical protein